MPPKRSDLWGVINNLEAIIMEDSKNELGYDELVDTVADGIEVYAEAKEALGDGVQVGDAFVLWSNLPKLQDVAKSANQAWKELLDLGPDEAVAAVEAIRARTSKVPDLSVEKIGEVLRLMARTYRLLDYTYAEGMDIVADAKKLFVGPVEN